MKNQRKLDNIPISLMGMRNEICLIGMKISRGIVKHKWDS
jgi:hypothetical protein